MDGNSIQATIKLALDPIEGTISGELHDDGQRERSFNGWLELINALETWRTGALSDDAREPDRAG